MIEKGEALFTKGLMHEAKEHFDCVLGTDPSNIDALNNMGVIHYHQQSTHQAVDCFLKVLEIDPSNKDALTNLSTILRNPKSSEDFGARG